MPDITLQLLGEPQLRLAGVPFPCRGMGLRLLAVLAVDGPSERLKLADLLWETTTHRALHNLRMAVHQLVRDLGEHGDLLRRRPGFLELDLLRVRVDTLCVPEDPSALLTHWRGFLPGQRSRGSEAWLEWAQRTEDRLLGEHVEHLRRAAFLHPEPLSGRLRRRARELVVGLSPEPVDPVPRPLSRPDPPVRQEPPPAHTAPFVGRGQVLDDVLAAVERRQMVFLSGAPGTGKTALQAALASLFGGRQFMPVASDPADRDGPYSTIYRALRDLQQGLNLGRWFLPEVPSGEVIAHLSQLREVRLSGDLDPLARPLLAEAFQQPFVSWGDDIHHWDDASTRVVARHSPRLLAQSPRAGVVNTFRPGDLNSGCRASVLRCIDQGRGVIIPIPALTRDEVAELSASFLPGVTDAQVGQLCHYAGGLPGLIVPVLNEAVRRGSLPERLTPVPAEAARLHLQLTQLGGRELEILRVLAVNDGAPVDVELLGGVLQVPRGTVVDALERLFHCGYLVGHEVHPPALRQTVLRHAPPLILADLAVRLRDIRNVSPSTRHDPGLTVN